MRIINYNEHRNADFNEEWLLHRNTYDCWQARGVLSAVSRQQKILFYQAALHRMPHEVGSHYLLHLSVFDLHSNKSTVTRKIFPSLNSKQGRIEIDEEALLCTDALQFLNVEDAIALKVEAEEFQIDLCLQKSHAPFWYGHEGVVSLGLNAKRGERLMAYAYPQMNSYGRIHIDGGSWRVKGRSVFERIYGHLPLKTPSSHAERFYLFFFDGEELMLLHLPQRDYQEGNYIDNQGRVLRLHNFELTESSLAEYQDYSYARSWRMQLPEIKDGGYYLLPADKNRVEFPVDRPILAIYNNQGDKMGYGFAELLPGARSKLKKIPGEIFWEL